MQSPIDFVAHVNSLKDSTVISYGRKCMRRYGLYKDVDGIWKTDLLSPELQCIVARHLAQFSGVPPSTQSSAAEIDSKIQNRF